MENANRNFTMIMPNSEYFGPVECVVIKDRSGYTARIINSLSEVEKYTKEVKEKGNDVVRIYSHINLEGADLLCKKTRELTNGKISIGDLDKMMLGYDPEARIELR